MHESEKWKVKSLIRVRLLATPWTAAYQAPSSMGFSRQQYWSWDAIAFSDYLPSNSASSINWLACKDLEILVHKASEERFKYKLCHVEPLLKTFQWVPTPHNGIPNPYNGLWDLEWDELWLHIQGILLPTPEPLTHTPRSISSYIVPNSFPFSLYLPFACLNSWPHILHTAAPHLLNWE